ncbi:uncharacterized protein LOC124253705 isoform X2 [Haliotis rubra]|uniref:uncharacterized protein LOC124253705 isoform X2 n=1 Tax=Haliotis rubra TaxID=36100 RepID=UPI001EE5E907|nr:uncharacterized protein LOC124253705 isoform X2 [Haliotis rubra]
MALNRPPALDGLSDWIVNIIVQKQPVNSTMKETIKQMISDNLSQTAERCRTFFEDQLAANKTEEEMKRYNSHMEDFLIQAFRQRQLELLESKDTPPPDEAHLHALCIYSDSLQEKLRLNDTVLLDRLIEQKAMSEAGRESILVRKTIQQQNAAFLKYVSQTFDADTFKAVFLPALKEEHECLATELSKAAANPTLSKFLLNRCLSCKIREQIRIRKFATCLYQIGAISAASHLDLTSTNMSQEDKWNHLMHETRQRPSVLMKALKRYNASLYNQLKSNRQLCLECTCHDDLNSTFGQRSESKDHDVARMSDFSDSSSQMYMETGDGIDARATARPLSEDTFLPRSRTSPLAGSNNEPEGPNHGIHVPQRMMKAPLLPVKKENPCTKQRGDQDRKLQRMWREHSTPTRVNNEFSRCLPRAVHNLEPSCNEDDNYNCMKKKRKRHVTELEGKEEPLKTIVDGTHARTTARPWSKDTFLSGSRTSSLTGSNNEPEGPNHGIHVPQRIMKAPIRPVNKENPCTKPRGDQNRKFQRMRRVLVTEHSTTTRVNNEFSRGLPRAVGNLEPSCDEVDNYNCPKKKRKR